MLTKNSYIKSIKNQVASNLGEEVVILNLNNGVYYGLDSVGARVWDLVQESRSVSEIHHTLLEEYAVDPEQCEMDLLALLNNMVAQGLVEVKDETHT